MLSRRAFLSSLAAMAAPARRKPNFVFILIDDYGWADTSFNGSRFYETPHLDALARSGMVFTNAYSASPVCSPTRSAIMTGKYPARLHITAHLEGARHEYPFSRVTCPDVSNTLALEQVTIAELLRERGYRTACIGKWHLGAKGAMPRDQGFDVAAGGHETGSTVDFFYPAWTKRLPLEGKDGEYLTDRLTDMASDFIRDNRTHPFFLYLAHYAVHTPIQGKPETVAKYRAKRKQGDAHSHEEYAAMIENMDQNLGRVLEALKVNGVDDHTVVIFTSDNGGVSTPWRDRVITSNAPLRAGKGYLYEGGIRVPAVIRYPGVTRSGSRCDVPVVSYDYAPTLAQIAGVPAGRTRQMEGRSVLPLLKDPATRWGRTENYWHYPHYSPQRGRPASAIRSGDDKLILFHEDNHVELYNLKEDIGETRDLAASQPEKAAALRARLDAWLRSTGAQLPVPNPQHNPAEEWRVVRRQP